MSIEQYNETIKKSNRKIFATRIKCFREMVGFMLARFTL